MSDLSEILDEVERFVSKYVVLGTNQLVAVALWAAHTYVLEAAEVTPYLAITSPERRTGKSRLLEVLACLVRAPISTTNISPSALFRAIDAGPATVLFDEVDTVFGRREGNEDLRALLNAGFARGGTVHRSEADGKKYTLRSFAVFAPKALAAIGVLPDTVADRCVHIRMKRKTATENVARLRRRVVQAEAERVRTELASWADGAVQELADAWPVLPEDLDDRAADAWEPLLAIADLAGHGWDGRARSAALALAEDKDSEESIGGLLLLHIRESLDGQERMATVELLTALVEREDGPWGRWWGNDVDAGRTKGPAGRLAKLLKPFGIAPTKWRDGELVLRGYEREGFEEPWARYLPHTPSETRHNATRHTNMASDQHVSLWRSPKGEGGSGVSVSESKGRDGCPECGSLWVFGHGEECSRKGH
jgi:Protein of unknown function (DUF3631)